MQKKSVLAIVGLILGLVSFPLLCLWYMGIFTGIVGLVCTLVSKPDGDKYSGIGVAALIINLMVIALGFTMMIVVWAGLKMSYEEESVMLYHITRL